MEYTFDTNNRPFRAIKAGTKKVEGRTPTDLDKIPYDEIKSGDLLTIINNSTDESLKVRVKFVHHYLRVKEMLEKEDPKNVLSSKIKTVEVGIEIYNSLSGYEAGIKRNGIYAIGLELL